jgi:hypothetical protein
MRFEAGIVNPPSISLRRECRLSLLFSLPHNMLIVIHKYLRDAVITAVHMQTFQVLKNWKV